MDGAVGATRHKRTGIESIKNSAARGALGLSGPVVHQLRVRLPGFFDHDMLNFESGCEGRYGSAAARISLRPCGLVPHDKKKYPHMICNIAFDVFVFDFTVPFGSKDKIVDWKNQSY